MSYGRRVRLAAKILFQTCTGGTPTVPPTPVVPAPVPKPPVIPPVAVLPKNINVAIFNQSTVVTDSQLVPIVAALQKQVTKDFAPIWGIDANVVFVPKGGTPDPTFWQLGIFDNSDQAGALGYHDITAEGQPLGKVFAETDIANNSSLSVTISHELLEMLADPDINLCVFNQTSDTAGIIYSYEVGDPVEDDSFGYEIDGVLVSDFVYPSWFESFRVNGPFDKQNKVTKPFQLLAGGYIGVYQIPNTGGWTQLTQDQKAKQYRNRAKLGSRRERRKTPRDQWQKSEVK